VPVPRRYDRRPPERDQTRINDRIRVPEVRLVGEDGKQIGVIKTPDALAYAQQRDLDLVEVAPEARPPVCRVLDYSKFKYELAQKQKQARKHQQQITIREIKFRPKIAQNDYDTKKGHVERFLKGKDKVKVTIMFRGREVTHPERGVALLNKLAGELTELAVVEQNPLQDGRNMTMMLAPSKAVFAEHEHEEHQAELEAESDEHHGGKKVHKHDLNAEAAATRAAEEAAEAAAAEEEEFDEDSEPAPITEIEPITMIEPEPAPKPSAIAAEPVLPDDVEETPGGRPAQKSKAHARTVGAAAKRQAALQAVADPAPAESPDPDPEPVAGAPGKAKSATAKARSTPARAKGESAAAIAKAKAEPAAKSATAESTAAKASKSKPELAQSAPAQPESAPEPAAGKAAAAKPASKPRSPKTNGNGTNGINGSTAKPKAKTGSKAS
jgi:translation initiation factor IF-3